MCINSGNICRCTSFPPIKFQTGTNKTHRQHAEHIKCFSCLLLNQLCNYLKDVLIVACSTLNISQRFSNYPSEIDWVNQSELWGNRRPASQRCVGFQHVCSWGRASVWAHVHVCWDVFVLMYVVCLCVRKSSVYRGDSWACSKGLLSILPVWEARSTQSIWTGI